MNGYLLDTNIISDILRYPNGLAAHRASQVDPKKIFTSIIVASELRYGCLKKGSPRLTARVEAVLETIPILAIDVPVDNAYGFIRAKLEAAGNPIGCNDLLIAAHAYVLDLTLVTNNTREFERVSHLKIENWLDDKKREP